MTCYNQERLQISNPQSQRRRTLSVQIYVLQHGSGRHNLGLSVKFDTAVKLSGDLEANFGGEDGNQEKLSIERAGHEEVPPDAGAER